MCSPAALPVAVQYASAAAAVVGTAATYQQGQTRKAVARYNAREAENKATQARQAGTEREMAHREKVNRLISQQRASFAASGVDIESGSPFKIQEDARILGEADALRIRSNFENQSTAFDRSAGLLEGQGDAASRAGTVGALGTALSEGGAVASKWYTPGSSLNQSERG